MDGKAKDSSSADRWVLWRQDENGHRFIVCTVPSRNEAEQALKAYEGRRHKQCYFIEPFRPAIP